MDFYPYILYKNHLFCPFFGVCITGNAVPKIQGCKKCSLSQRGWKKGLKATRKPRFSLEDKRRQFEVFWLKYPFFWPFLTCFYPIFRLKSRHFCSLSSIQKTPFLTILGGYFTREKGVPKTQGFCLKKVILISERTKKGPKSTRKPIFCIEDKKRQLEGFWAKIPLFLTVFGLFLTYFRPKNRHFCSLSSREKHRFWSFLPFFTPFLCKNRCFCSLSSIQKTPFLTLLGGVFYTGKGGT